MTQTELLQIVMSMNGGQAYRLSLQDMNGCAQGSLTYLDGSPRKSDIDDFIRTVSENWEVTFEHDGFNMCWTMYKNQDEL